MALCAILESLGYRVFQADDGKSAFDEARRVHPDLILMDIMMPGVDGLEATRMIRASTELPAVRIVALSAMEGAQRASSRAGCDGCILKPVDLSTLASRLSLWLDGD